MFFFGIFFVMIFIIIHKKNLKSLYKSPEITKYPLVSFLVPAFNEEKNIENTIDAILKIDYPK